MAIVNNDVIRDKKMIGIESIIYTANGTMNIINAPDIADFEELDNGRSIMIKKTNGEILLCRNCSYLILGNDKCDYLHSVSTI